MEPSSVSVVALSTINGKNISDENSVFKNNTGITAFDFNACFLNES
jgi:outer membrane receptor for ferric coprogen and ferric-rhodotorulic acid